MTTTGFFELKSPQDLVKKVRHDIARLRANPIDSYAAFDFFVTARHVPDWLFPRDKSKVADIFKSHVELRICRHLGDGAKHLQATRSTHKQVQDTHRTSDTWGGSWGKSWGSSWGTNDLTITLDPQDADTVALGPSVRAIDLAEKVLTILEGIVL